MQKNATQFDKGTDRGNARGHGPGDVQNVGGHSVGDGRKQNAEYVGARVESLKLDLRPRQPGSGTGLNLSQVGA